ncbi:hypothetical protein LCGC14_2102410, partial [marine sediment metagenome]
FEAVVRMRAVKQKAIRAFFEDFKKAYPDFKMETPPTPPAVRPGSPPAVRPGSPQAPQGASTQPGGGKAKLRVLKARFEPIGQGKNVVRLTVRNASAEKQVFAVHIQTRSPRYGGGMGWGTQFYHTIGPRQSKRMRFAFNIQGPVTDATWIRLGFYNPRSVEAYESDDHFEERRFTPRDLTQRPPAARLEPVTGKDTREVHRAFAEIQDLLRDRKYGEVWKRFTKDYQQAEFQDRGSRSPSFKEAMEGAIPWSWFIWNREEFLELRPASVGKRSEVYVLAAKRKEQTWAISLVRDADVWKVDWIGGYVPRLVLQHTWEERLLPKMKKAATAHFDIYCFEGSSSARAAKSIAKRREQGYQAISEFLGTKSDVRIRLILFEDKRAKHRETGHQGMGWAFGQTIVEVYGEEGHLDPYHETTHVLARSMGSPPALFQEGLAVYVSERLGAPALKDLGGGKSSLQARVRELKRKNQWVDLEKLLTYTEIGSRRTRPPISYAEAGAFVKFLIEKHGMAKFRRAYGELKGSADANVHRGNKATLQTIYGQSLEGLDREWQSTFSAAGVPTPRPPPGASTQPAGMPPIALLYHGDSNVRIRTIQTLGKAGDPRMIDDLIRAHSVEFYTPVHNAYASVLRSMTGERTRRGKGQWKAWLADQAAKGRLKINYLPISLAALPPKQRAQIQ